MIPNQKQCYALWDKYKLPSSKRIHIQVVTNLALFLAKSIIKQHPQIKIDLMLLEAACLLHDIDQQIKPLPGEKHPDTAVRMLKQLEFHSVAQVVAKHALHCIMDGKTASLAWEEKLLFLADKMVKYELIGVEHRIKLWLKENWPETAKNELTAAYPKVKQLEQEILQLAGVSFADIKKEF